jgi:alpha-L-rhamnosidase
MLYETDPSTLSAVRTTMEHNFIMLLQLQRYWPGLKLSLSRLRAFHRACLQNHSHRNFDMDQWMITFLNRYQSTVPERCVGGELESWDVGQPIIGSPDAGELWKEISGITCS